MRRPWPALGRSAVGKNKSYISSFLLFSLRHIGTFYDFFYYLIVMRSFGLFRKISHRTNLELTKENSSLRESRSSLVVVFCALTGLTSWEILKLQEGRWRRGYWQRQELPSLLPLSFPFTSPSSFFVHSVLTLIIVWLKRP